MRVIVNTEVREACRLLDRSFERAESSLVRVSAASAAPPSSSLSDIRLKAEVPTPTREGDGDPMPAPAPAPFTNRLRCDEADCRSDDFAEGDPATSES